MWNIKIADMRNLKEIARGGHVRWQDAYNFKREQTLENASKMEKIRQIIFPRMENTSQYTAMHKTMESGAILKSEIRLCTESSRIGFDYNKDAISLRWFLGSKRFFIFCLVINQNVADHGSWLLPIFRALRNVYKFAIGLQFIYTTS